MHAPMAPSSYYRENGRPHAVRAYGLTMFLTPVEYAKLRADPGGRGYPDATEEQIAQHDAWYEQARAEQDRETAAISRLGRLLHGPVDP